MTIPVLIPSMLRHECGGRSELRVEAGTVREALCQLERSHPAVYRSVCDETGAVRRHVNLFVNDSFLPKHEGLDRAFRPGDCLSIMPAVSGG